MEKKIKFKKAPNFKIPSTDGKIFELNKSEIEIVSGHTSRMKKVKIIGAEPKEIIDYILHEVGA